MIFLLVFYLSIHELQTVSSGLDVNRTAAVTTLSKEHSDRFSEVMNETNDGKVVARIYICINIIKKVSSNERETR